MSLFKTMSVLALVMLAVASTADAAASITSVTHETRTGAMETSASLKVTGTLTLVRDGKTIVYKTGQAVMLREGDKVTLAGSAERAGYMGLSSKGGTTTFDVKDKGVFAVTDGALQVTQGANTATAVKGQTIEVVETAQMTTRNYSSGGSATNYDSVTFSIVVTSPQQETANGGTNTVSPSTP